MNSLGLISYSTLGRTQSISQEAFILIVYNNNIEIQHK